ncbi:hypothetical protein [Nocardia sp. CNY236]|uniref:hypothetical protein n=1 Tax=Nocardia sp. CNY236 TaxID=1169152 RepID=UPI00048BE298|nr:hypothetical protein [Nocardia sp. CNY236]
MSVTTVSIRPNARLDVFDWIGLGVLNLLWGVVIGVWWLVLFPMISIPAALIITGWLLLGWPTGLTTAAVSVAGLVCWQRQRPDNFHQWVTGRARTRVLAWWRYRRRWARLMRACHLSIDRADRSFVPRLLAVTIGVGIDRVRLRMLEGHCPADYENRVQLLAHAFGADDCRAEIVGPATVELAFRHGDCLAETVVLPRVDHWTTPRKAA